MDGLVEIEWVGQNIVRKGAKRRATGQTKQAKTLSEDQEACVLDTLARRGGMKERNVVMFLLSAKAGLRAKEIACLTWRMVTNSEMAVGEMISLHDDASKGNSGREIPLNQHLHQALVTLLSTYPEMPDLDAPVIRSQRGGRMSPASVVDWFWDLYMNLGFFGCSSHSGRRTFITRTARRIAEVGGSLRDVQGMAGHASLLTTQRYIEGHSEARRKVVNLV